MNDQLRIAGRAWSRLIVAVAAASAFAAVAQTPASRPANQPPPPPPRPVSTAPIVPLERVIAVVNDDALTQWELDEQKKTILAQMKSQNVPPPPSDVLDKQLLERLIIDRALMQYAKETGIKVDDTQVERTIARIAQENKLSGDQFKAAVEREGISYAKYREDMRNEIIIARLRDREVDSKITVSDAEVDNLLATIAAQTGGETDYHLYHVLVLVPEQASPDQIEAKRKRAEEALKQIRAGADFGQVAAGFSDAPDALKGGDLGWRSPARMPTVFAEPVRAMKAGEVSAVLRSSTGFHIVKVTEIRNRNQATLVEQTRAKHILIKVNEITSESDAKTKIDRIKDRIDSGGAFDDQARLNSEDASASKGGDLGWISPGDTVPDFEQAMGKLKVGEMSAPVRSPFGWHLIVVTERREQDVSKERQRDQARQALRQRKAEEGFQDWLRTVRDRAYVELKVDEK